jgi:glycosyltransferase involved in cell wall biosynthesis
MGKPVITTDTSGCREVVDHGDTGYLCSPRSVESLVTAMLQMIDRSPEERSELGRRARLKAERYFDEQLVIDAYLAVVGAIVSQPLDDHSAESSPFRNRVRPQ